MISSPRPAPPCSAVKASWSLSPLTVAVAAVMALAASLQTGCESPRCTSSDECGDGEYCATVEEACMRGASVTGTCVEQPTSCPPTREPVCGCDGKTYDNTCAAALAGVSVASDGECARTCEDCGDGAFCDAPLGACGEGTECTPRPTACPAVEEPACGCDGATYANTCEAKRAGVSVFREGACEEPVGLVVGVANVGRRAELPEQVEAAVEACGGTEDLTCSSRGTFCSFPGGTCADAHPRGECIAPPTDCPAAEAPVCGCDGRTHANACEAARAQTSVLREGACEAPELPEEPNFACGGPSQTLCPEGTFCELETGSCFGVNPEGTCQPLPSSCAAAVDSEVCGCDGRTYDSRCDAALSGVAVLAEGPCACGPGLEACAEGTFCELAPGACLDHAPRGECAAPRAPESCPAVVAPVCGCDDQTYDNACLAGANGTSVAFLGACL